MSRELAPVPGMLGAQPGGDQEIDSLADQLILGVAKHPLRLAVGQHDLSKRLDYYDAEGAGLDQARQNLFRRARIACNDGRKATHTHVRLRVSAVERSMTCLDAE
jgi:hypothetical protein